MKRRTGVIVTPISFLIFNKKEFCLYLADLAFGLFRLLTLHVTTKTANHPNPPQTLRNHLKPSASI